MKIWAEIVSQEKIVKNMHNFHQDAKEIQTTFDQTLLVRSELNLESIPKLSLNIQILICCFIN